ncbi:carboxylating nicotinate-nucleotide diphosphorylase [Candidatus Woesearchaeota archaeon]|nr:carboxylating nicotinate-nucleotide diphosphorylase [Candidatus Woesearchaeota archaeon]
MKEIIPLALKEDIGSGDITSELIKDRIVTARIAVGEDCVVSGIDAAVGVFRSYDKKITIIKKKRNGNKVKKGIVVLEIKGRLKSILACERTAINFLQHLSGIATTANEFAGLVRGTKVILLDTRKTTPGMREFEKRAVVDGGMKNHRLGLYDMILVKDNHIKAEGLKRILNRINNIKNKKTKIEIEVDNLRQLRTVIKNNKNIDIIMVDNFSIKNTNFAVKMIRRAARKIKIEYSGKVNKRRLRNIAKTGVNYISIGQELALSARAIDFGMEVSG